MNSSPPPSPSSPPSATPADGAAPSTLGAFRKVPYMGVIYVVAEAHKLGFYNGHPEWCNLGQGQPEVGEMEGAPERLKRIDLEPGDHAYGPIEGTPELRSAIAQHYNRLYRAGKSQYGPQNVCVAQGGRLALTRTLAALDSVHVGYQLPDYTAYEDMLGMHLGRITAIPLRARLEDGLTIPAKRLEAAIDEHGLSAFLVSNPCNPTGAVVEGQELAAWVDIARRRGTTLLLDEFYSHFIYTEDGRPGDASVSAAAFIDDLEQEPVLIIDGLTKNYRYPGWRIGWVLGPEAMIDSLARTGSSIDGGPSRVAQRIALEALQADRADQETQALRVTFAAKRNLMLESLSALGVRFAHRSTSTFYLWGDLSGVRPPFNDAQTFFRAALERKVMTVPGEFFDVNPGGRRRGDSQYRNWMRFSFGPPIDNVRLGLDRLNAMVAGA